MKSMKFLLPRAKVSDVELWFILGTKMSWNLVFGI